MSKFMRNVSIKVDDPDPRPKSNNHKVHTEDIFLKSDLHGLPDWYEANNLATKITWTVVLILAFIILTVELVKTCQDFKDNPIITTYSIVSDPGKLPFPEIYLCPSNPIHRERKSKKNVKPEWEKENVEGFLKAHADQSAMSGLLGQKSTISQALAQFQPAVGGGFGGGFGDGEKPTYWIPEDIEDYFLQVGYQTEDFFIQCSFNSIEIPCQQIVESVFDGDHGKCFIVRTPKNDPKQRSDGIGLSLVMSLDWDNANDMFEPIIYDGITMKISRKYDIGLQRFTLLEPGKYIRAELEATKLNLIERLKEIGGQTCIDEEEGRKNMTHINSSIYSPGICYHDCYQQLVVDKCSCYMPINKTLIKTISYPSCNVEQLKNCALPSINQYNTTLTNCATWCKVPCTQWKYTIDTSAANFPSESIKNSFYQPPQHKKPETAGNNKELPSEIVDLFNMTSHSRNIRSVEDKNQSDQEKEQQVKVEMMHNRWRRGDMIILDIAYSSLQFTEITQENSMTFTTFVGNIGGHVGLWIGASIITLIKFVILLLTLCSRRVKRKFKQSHKVTENG